MKKNFLLRIDEEVFDKVKDISEVEERSINYMMCKLIDKGLKKGELNKITRISESTMAKLAKGENVNTDILERICNALNCQIGDIVEVIDLGGYKDGK